LKSKFGTSDSLKEASLSNADIPGARNVVRMMTSFGMQCGKKE
jgi:hypothetical protein